MDKRFLTAFSAPDKWEIMGFELKPFSTRHMIALHAVDSPFLSFERFPEPFETIAFLRICSMPRASYQVKPGFLDSLFAFRLYRNPSFHVDVCKSIAVYMGEYCSSPKVVERARKNESVIKNRTGDLPAALATLTMAIARLNMTEEEALDAPVGRLSWYAYCFGVLEGNDDLKLITTEAEERAEDDRQSILKHEAEVEKKLLEAMKNGKIAKRKIRRTTT